MTDEERNILEMDVADAMTGKPHGFRVGGRHFCLFPVTLGKMLLLSRLTEGVGIDRDILSANPFLEALRLIETKREECCKIITYHTLGTREALFNQEQIASRTAYLSKHCGSDDLATLLILCLTWDKTDRLADFLGIKAEQERLRRVMEAKDKGNTLTFGCKSVYGALIGAACERYGWTADYVLWGISYTNLRLMLMDAQQSVYLSDEELKRCPASVRGNVISGDDPEAVREAIRSINWS